MRACFSSGAEAQQHLGAARPASFRRGSVRRVGSTRTAAVLMLAHTAKRCLREFIVRPSGNVSSPPHSRRDPVLDGPRRQPGSCAHSGTSEPLPAITSLGVLRRPRSTTNSCHAARYPCWSEARTVPHYESCSREPRSWHVHGTDWYAEERPATSGYGSPGNQSGALTSQNGFDLVGRLTPRKSHREVLRLRVVEHKRIHRLLRS